MEKMIHEGRNVKRIREILGMKQEALAIELGEDWNQKKISQLESKDTIEPQILDQVAKALKVPVDAIKNFNEDAAVNIVSSTFNDNASVNSYSVLNFNPIDKIVELYERMLKEKQEMIDKLSNKG
jgi:transcriptional regulator with XRE-family HTH domain